MKIEDYNLSRSEISAIIDEWIFDERERAMLKRRYLDGVCFETLAEEFSLSVQRTKKIIYKARNKLFKHIRVEIK